jgi:hypothetical protein
MDEEREPFPTEDPRQTGTGDQLPEENPEGQGAEGAERRGPERGSGGAGAPGTSSEDEGDPGQATGNPGAAG